MTNKTTSAIDLVERVARAMFEQVESRTIEASAELSADPSLWLTWETVNEPTREPYREQARAAIEAMQPADTITRLKAALTPSAETKAAYIGEFRFPVELYHPRLGTETRWAEVPWKTIKEIMAAIREHASSVGGE